MFRRAVVAGKWRKVCSGLTPWSVRCVAVESLRFLRSYCQSPSAHHLENPTGCGFDRMVWYLHVCGVCDQNGLLCRRQLLRFM